MQVMTAELLKCVGVPETRDQVAEKLGALMNVAACLIAEDLIRGGKDLDDGAPRMADWCAQQIMTCMAEVGPKLKMMMLHGERKC
jgi:hypothetical protein